MNPWCEPEFLCIHKREKYPKISIVKFFKVHIFMNLCAGFISGFSMPANVRLFQKINATCCKSLSTILCLAMNIRSLSYKPPSILSDHHTTTPGTRQYITTTLSHLGRYKLGGWNIQSESFQKSSQNYEHTVGLQSCCHS